ncbi:similar to Saccharomyces cerevisiae YJL096W MRPL49 Mitochondrial ribosomal protein of the large subunit [Maudiozyma saulgeensis]|uniref:Large ribosomal subunit protein bL21m n=1 Tax=Maudiozyma saulgeensis TaxID=1789683 RepID=A0A1X7R7R5_9SACH|nr:similar to Saccharomyces cerevisiae YJL096W MRPL49 Mitochondrial ribosomal protein of the large subunit [Kazachstania saulgeensis]
MLRSLSRAVAINVGPMKCLGKGTPSMGIGMLIRYNSTSTKNTPVKESTLTGPVDTTPLKLSNELFAEFRVHGRPYVVTEGDKVILPYKVKNAEVGDILNLTDVRTIGSRNYKLVNDPIDPSLYNLKATVLEKTKRKFEIREVTKRRNRRVRHAKSKGDLTMIRISELSVN